MAPPQVVPLCSVGLDPATYSAGLLDFVAGFAVGRDELTAAQVQGWATELRRWARRLLQPQPLAVLRTKAAGAAVGWMVARNASTA